MRLSRLLGKTQREIPAESETLSHQLLLRAGMIQQEAAGVYSYLPLGWRVLTRIQNIIREEMDRAGGQEVMLPALQPIEIWQRTGREQAFGKSLFSLTDRRERTLVLGPTHEEIVTGLVAHNVRSYRDLPLLVYQIQTKFRDEPRPRGGLLRAREFIMKDAYSFDVDEASLDRSYQDMLKAYRRLYARCGLPAVLVEADSGAIGGKASHEFMLLTESGEDEVISCPSCHYAANVEKARSTKIKVGGGEPQPLEELATPGASTIPEVSRFLNIPESHTLKAVFYVADGELLFAVIRGDLEVNDVKLTRVLGAHELRLATEAEVKAAGLVAGAASPVGLNNIRIIADDSIESGSNFVAGANKPSTHLKNVNYPCDFAADIVADIARARAGDACPECDGKLTAARAIEVGHIFKLGTFISDKLDAVFIDAKGVSRPMIMGCYGIGVGRLMAAAIEQNHDDKGIIWPLPIAPYQVCLSPLFMDNPEVVRAAEQIYSDLNGLKVEVLYDDRLESPGVKFNDADLLGIPYRITISPRTIEKNSVELKKRTEKKAQLLPLDGIARKMKELIDEDFSRIPQIAE